MRMSGLMSVVQRFGRDSNTHGPHPSESAGVSFTETAQHKLNCSARPIHKIAGRVKERGPRVYSVSRHFYLSGPGLDFVRCQNSKEQPLPKARTDRSLSYESHSALQWPTSLAHDTAKSLPKLIFLSVRRLMIKCDSAELHTLKGSPRVECTYNQDSHSL